MMRGGAVSRAAGRCMRPRLSSSLQQYCTPPQAGGRTTHFGEKTVPLEEKERMVRGVFDNVASKYDLMNDAMSAGMHRLWKDHFVSSLQLTPGQRILDVAGGTGDVAFRVLDTLDAAAGERQGRGDGKQPGSKVTISDINPSMLAVGKQRFQARPDPLHTEIEVEFKEANAEELPFADNSFDVYTIAFGIRNVTNIDKALKEAHRVLARGGRLMVLEFSRVDTPLISNLYDAYSFNVIPAMGKALANDSESYQYLVESIRKFPDSERFAAMIRDAGFRAVNYEKLTFGVVSIHWGWKV
eukprot:Hpha_TRINITY_DN29712_c0_g1::TRINITY_DN29712_c0_g1_i1::g.2739::m.2739/K06127/COQ5; 2-methoxy-6-polyprenyl-1,4-benzoquinol methylase